MPVFIDKPIGWTSHDIVAKARGVLGTKKIGHAGTLDPMATGLLIVLVGRDETKLQDQYMASEKEYIAEITLGQTSNTYDAEGELTSPVSIEHITQKMIEAVLPQFTGTIQQQPPIFSALKVNGKAMYKLARAGNIVQADVPTREVTIYELELQDVAIPKITLRIHCGKGTYIRSLANDIGAALGVGAYLSALRRTRIGEYTVDQAMTMEDFIANGKAAHIETAPVSTDA